MPYSIQYKPVDKTLVHHPVERRGFVSVPFDHSDPSSERIEIFYRLLPPHGSTVSDASKPIVVVINGGPGIPSSFYRPLDFDYAKNEPPQGGLDRFKYLLRSYRVLLADQRGTDGLSAPIDMDHPSLDASLVSRFFSSDSHARDYAAVIDHVIPPGEKFFIIAQSYGGMPGMQYLSLSNARTPAGIVFSSSALPYEPVIETMKSRRREQLALNHQLKAAVPDIESRIARARAHLAAVGLDPNSINGMFTWLGKDVTGVWERAFADRLEKLEKQSREEIEGDVTGGLGEVNLLNYILSSVNFTAGHTDRTLAEHTSRTVPFEPWMIDENWLLLQTGQDGTWRGPWVDAFDRSPPPPTPFASLDDIRKAIGRHQLLFTAADNDAFVPAASYLRSVEKFLVPGHTEVRRIPGGHHAIFLEKGYEALTNWAREKG